MFIKNSDKLWEVLGGVDVEFVLYNCSEASMAIAKFYNGRCGSCFGFVLFHHSLKSPNLFRTTGKQLWLPRWENSQVSVCAFP